MDGTRACRPSVLCVRRDRPSTYRGYPIMDIFFGTGQIAKIVADRLTSAAIKTRPAFGLRLAANVSGKTRRIIASTVSTKKRKNKKSNAFTTAVYCDEFAGIDIKIPTGLRCEITKKAIRALQATVQINVNDCKRNKSTAQLPVMSVRRGSCYTSIRWFSSRLFLYLFNSFAIDVIDT